MITIMDAIQALKPGAECLVRGDTYSGIEWLDKNQTQPTEEEVNAKVTELTNAEPMNLLRVERTRRLSESDWMANSDVTMSDEWKTYRQALRDLPKVHPVSYGDPKLDSNGSLDMSSITWPTPPS
tara:strand:+ start:321 stop:695 length:375 start_codon:yes stop_codon:yes gene_type:complete